MRSPTVSAPSEGDGAWLLTPTYSCFNRQGSPASSGHASNHDEQLDCWPWLAEEDGKDGYRSNSIASIIKDALEDSSPEHIPLESGDLPVCVNKLHVPFKILPQKKLSPRPRSRTPSKKASFRTSKPSPIDVEFREDVAVSRPDKFGACRVESTSECCAAVNDTLHIHVSEPSLPAAVLIEDECAATPDDAGSPASDSTLLRDSADAHPPCASPECSPAHQNLRLSEAPTSPNLAFIRGDQVCVVGLRARPEFNGLAGTIVAFDEAQGRWKVRMSDGSAKKLKQVNLQKTGPTEEETSNHSIQVKPQCLECTLPKIPHIESTTGYLSDPVWGEVHFIYGTMPSRLQLLCFGLCPCLMIGCGGRRRFLGHNRLPVSVKAAHQAWRRFLLSFANLLTIIQFGALLYSLMSGDGFASLEHNAMLGPHSHTLDSMGAKNPARVLYQGEWWRLLTTLFLHSGLIHFVMNAMVQMRVGVTLEVLWGHHIWLLIYAASGAYSSLLSCIVFPDSLSVGASGAICGIIGAGLTFTLMTWTQKQLPGDLVDRNFQLSTLAMTVVITLLLSGVPMVDFAAHIGGFVSGAMLALGVFADWADSARADKVRIAMKAVGGTSFGLAVLFTHVYFTNSTKPSRDLLSICDGTEC